jgi:hypothetical protein
MQLFRNGVEKLLYLLLVLGIGEILLGLLILLLWILYAFLRMRLLMIACEMMMWGVIGGAIAWSIILIFLMLHAFYKESVGPKACINQSNEESNSAKQTNNCDKEEI